MSVVIDPELVNFKTKVGGSLGSMNTALSTLSSKISELTSINTSTQTAVSSVYFSENQAQVLSKFTNINNIYNQISSSLEGDLKTILSNSSTLVDNVTKLESLKSAIDKLESDIASERASLWDSDKDGASSHNASINSRIASLQSDLSAKTNEFNTLHMQAKSDLSTLKGFDSTLSFVSNFKSVDLSTISQYLTGGSFEKYSFTASNGYTVDYYLYVPEYSVDVTGLPVHMYLHGYGEDERDGLPEIFRDGYNPNGIVICPQSSGGPWRDDECQDALIELTNNIVEQYSADPNKISLSGNSRGAIGGYKLISRYPDYFSAYVPISGHSSVMEDSEASWAALGDVEIWAFHGTGDSQVPYSGATGTQKRLRERGYDNMQIYTLNGAGHGIQQDVLGKKYEYIDGVKYSPIEWAMSQTKNG